DPVPRRDPSRAVLGGTLTQLVIAGLAALAGGSPKLGASTASLSSAGGWIGAVVGNPLRAGLGGFGAATVLVAVMVVALVLFTGVSVRTAAHGMAVAAGWAYDLARGGPEGRSKAVEADADDEHPTDPFGRIVPDGDPSQVAAEGPDPDMGVVPEVALPVVAGLADPASGPPDPLTLPDAAVKAGTGSQLEMKLGAGAGGWKLPPPGILKRLKPHAVDEREVDAGGTALVHALAAHGVETRLVGRTVGPSVTRYELELGAGVKVARVTSLSKDIAYAMASPDVRILAPIPGKSAIGVEVPNRRRQLVALGDILASPEAAKAHHPLEVALGRDIAGHAYMVNLADMPHLLVSGSTGSGKSSCINSILTSILTRATPDQVRLMLVDPKRVELGQYNDLPHLLTQVVVDPKKAANALSWAVKEMERRYDLLAEAGMRDITGYNLAVDAGQLDDHEEAYRLRMLGRAADGDESGEPEDVEPRYQRLPFILIVVDELNDLMMVAARDVEDSVCRIAQMARAVGIHLVLATQRPSVDVITGVIKANIPSRMAFSVSSLADSRVILDQPGAERLIGKGDMLLVTASSSNPQRLQAPWVGEDEVRAVAAHWKRQRPMEVVAGIDEATRSGIPGERGADDDDDELLAQAMDLVVRSQLGSTSMLQRKLRVGFARAGRLMDLMERGGVVGPSEGSKARTVLMTVEELEAR
ncbi:MAG TPA: DNA translocase FtsK, partial [Acidimicrobiales bacterium]|nr:DNA translocase FtsK [Acidimicrobiales bacterium]